MVLDILCVLCTSENKGHLLSGLLNRQQHYRQQLLKTSLNFSLLMGDPQLFSLEAAAEILPTMRAALPQ